MLAAALNEAGLGAVEVMIEYELPLNSKRADVVLAGSHPATGAPSYVVVELKQWSQAAPDEDDPEWPYAAAHRRKSGGTGESSRGAPSPGLRRPDVGRLLLALVEGAETG